MTVWRKIAASVVFALALLSSYTYAQPDEYQFTFEMDSRTQLDSLSQMISIDRIEGSRVWAYANADEMARFRLTGICFELNAEKSAAKDYPMATTIEQMQNIDRYPTYEVYDAMMRKFAHDYPQLCQLEVIATLESGRQILALKISKDVELNNTDKPEVLCTSTMHGDEGICATTALSFCRHLLENYDSDSYVSRLMDSIEFWVIPIMNPDGMYKGGNSSISGSTRSNGNTYDLNRNFPKLSGGGNTLQPETQAMMDFFARHHFALSTNLHAGNECFNYPWDTWSRTTADNDWWRLVGAAYRDTAQYYGSNGYFDDGCLNSANGLTNGYAWYSVSGGQQDWANYFMHCREVTIEVCGTKEPTSTTTIANIWKYNKNSLLNFYAESLNGVRGTVTNTAGQPLAARITIAGHDKDNSWVETDIRAGDYHRFLKAGTYNLTFEADGYLPQTIEAKVIDGKPTWLNVVLLGENYALSVEPANIDVRLLQSTTTQRQIVVTNIGKISNSFSLTTDGAGWLTFDHSDGTLPAGQSSTLTATISSGNLNNGNYSSVVTLQSVSQTVTVNFNLEVKDSPDEIGFAHLPKKLEYSVGDSLDLSGGLIFLRYCNDSVAHRPLTRQMVRGFDSGKVGMKPITVSIEGTEIIFYVVVIENAVAPPTTTELQSVAIKALPDKRIYHIGENLDLSGGLLTLAFSNDSTAVVPMNKAVVAGFNNKQTGTVLLTVKYGTFTNAFSVSVIEKPYLQPTVVSAVLTALPLKLEYYIGQILDLSGGQLTVGYSNDSTAVLSLQSSMVSGFNSDSAGAQWITVNYNNTINAFCVNVLDTADVSSGISHSEPRVYTQGNTIVIENARSAIAVYDMTGRCVARRGHGTAIIRIALGKSGAYIVRIGQTNHKISIL